MRFFIFKTPVLQASNTVLFNFVDTYREYPILLIHHLTITQFRILFSVKHIPANWCNKIVGAVHSHFKLMHNPAYNNSRPLMMPHARHNFCYVMSPNIPENSHFWRLLTDCNLDSHWTFVIIFWRLVYLSRDNIRVRELMTVIYFPDFWLPFLPCSVLPFAFYRQPQCRRLFKPTRFPGIEKCVCFGIRHLSLSCRERFPVFGLEGQGKIRLEISLKTFLGLHQSHKIKDHPSPLPSLMPRF